MAVARHGTVGNTSVHHVSATGRWEGPSPQYAPEHKQNMPLCDLDKKMARRIVVPAKLCRDCEETLGTLQLTPEELEEYVRREAPHWLKVAEDRHARGGRDSDQPDPPELTIGLVLGQRLNEVYPDRDDQVISVVGGGRLLHTGPGKPSEPAQSELPSPRNSIRIRRRQCFVVHPYQRALLVPQWPAKWGPFDTGKFYEGLEPVTVIHASQVRGLEKFKCLEHGESCGYQTWPDAEYIVLGGQHRTQEAGKLYGPDWEFWAVERTDPLPLERLGKSWWVSEDRRTPGTREVFAKKVLDGVPEYVEMAGLLEENGFAYQRGGPLRDFTSVGSLASLWQRSPGAVRVMVEVLGASGCGTRQPLVRALFEVACWNDQDAAGIRWRELTEKMARRGADELAAAEKGSSVDGKAPWQRVAVHLGRIYNIQRPASSPARIVFPDF